MGSNSRIQRRGTNKNGDYNSVVLTFLCQLMIFVGMGFTANGFSHWEWREKL